MTILKGINCIATQNTQLQYHMHGVQGSGHAILWTDLPAASQALPDAGLMPAPTRFPWPAQEAAETVWWTTPCTACPMNTCITAVGLGLGQYSGFPWCITRATEWRGLGRVWGLAVGPPSDQGHILFVWSWQRPRQCTILSIRD